MRFLIEHLLGVIRPINPFDWPAHVRRLRTSEGWVPPMMVLAALGVLAGMNWGFGLLGQNGVVRFFNYLSLATWFVVASLATCAVLVDSVRNIARYGFVPLSRPRWWFEVSRTTWIIALVVGLTLPMAHLAAVPLAMRFADTVFAIVPIAIGMFFVSATLGFAISALTGRPRRGRAYECVQYFYVVFGATFGITAFAIWLPNVAPAVNGPLTVAACVVTASLLGIFVLKLSERMKRRSRDTAT
jgi:hypothetical protein